MNSGWAFLLTFGTPRWILYPDDMSIKKSNTNKKTTGSGKNNEYDGSYKQFFSHPEMVESLIRDFVSTFRLNHSKNAKIKQYQQITV
jgi:hypothetical protein